MMSPEDVLASVKRPQARQGAPLTVIPLLILTRAAGSLFQPISSWVFSQTGGGSILKRYQCFAAWTPELEDAIALYGLTRDHPIQKGDQLIVPPDISVKPIEIDDADAYPDDHIEIQILQLPTARPRNP